MRAEVAMVPMMEVELVDVCMPVFAVAVTVADDELSDAVDATCPAGLA
jgi:hypothetical protein